MAKKKGATDQLQAIIEDAFERRATLSVAEIEGSTRPAVEEAIALLESGKARVATPSGGKWEVQEWLKKAVLLYFRVNDMALVESYPAPFWDKVPLRFEGWDDGDFRDLGAHVGAGTMVDTWATVGSCAQVGKRCHLSGGAGIGGVLEPLQASPTIIEDDCFIGARAEVVEGVVVEKGSVIGMGVFLGQSTRIYDRATGTIGYGRVPAGSVVVSGSLPAADGSHSLYCAVIVKRVDAKTRAKTSVNELLRGAVE